jgi:O-6-methylguanine DNA methyltransferase
MSEYLIVPLTKQRDQLPISKSLHAHDGTLTARRGRYWVAATDNVRLSHVGLDDGRPATARRTFSPVSGRTRKVHRSDQRAKEFEATIFAPPQNQSRPKLRAFVRGTPFQLRVWRALLQGRAGWLTTYGRLSAAIGQPQAARAVGSGVGGNPVAFIIPRHRAIRETRVPGNYR